MRIFNEELLTKSSESLIIFTPEEGKIMCEAMQAYAKANPRKRKAKAMAEDLHNRLACF